MNEANLRVEAAFRQLNATLKEFETILPSPFTEELGRVVRELEDATFTLPGCGEPKEPFFQEVVSALMEMAWHCCWLDTRGIFDSMSVPAYEGALRVLARCERVQLLKEGGTVKAEPLGEEE